MRTIRTRVQPTGVWLVARLYQAKKSERSRFSIRLVSQGRATQVARGDVPEMFAGLPRKLGVRTVSTVSDFEAALAALAADSEFAAELWKALSAGEKALELLNIDYSDAPLPVFAAADFPLDEETWASLLVATAHRLDDLQRPVEVVPASVGRRPMRQLPAKLALPMDIQCSTWLAGPLAERTWFLRADAVRQHGMSLKAVDAALPKGDNADIVIGDASRIGRAEAERWLGDSTSTARLRVLVNASFEPLWQPRLVRGTAALVFPTQNAEEAFQCLHVLVNEITHDRALHHALHECRRYLSGAPDRSGPVETWLRGPRLYTEPNADQWFRLSNALPQALDAANVAYELGIGGKLGPFLGRLAGQIGASPQMDTAVSSLRALHRATSPLREALDRGVTFGRESDGLLPMAQILAARSEFDSRGESLRSAFSNFRQLPGVDDALEQVQERKVDASLALLFGDQAPMPFRRNQGIPADALLRLSVHIGQRSVQSLIVGRSPSLDPLLPELADDEIHELDIVLVPKDFGLAFEQPTTHKVRLARFGGTVPVSWDLRSPAVQDGSKGAERLSVSRFKKGDIGELRFSVYFKNQLLQSFNLRATLGDAFPYGHAGRTEIKCDFSQTRRFGSLSQLGDRVINLAINEDMSGRHTLAVKGSGIDAAAITWDSAFLANYVDVLRDALFDGLVSSGASRFSFEPKNFVAQPTAKGTFEASVQSMAEAGAALYEQLYQMNSAALTAALDLARTTRDQVIQVALLHPNYTLPWGLIYDFDIPEAESGKDIPVCRGFDSGGKPCACMPDDGTALCLRGFWGFRHTIEQLAGTQAPFQDVPGKITAAMTVPVMGFIRTLDDAYTQSLSSLWKLPGPVEEYPPPTSFVGLFADPLKRPAVVLYVGHQDVDGPKKAPTPKLLTVDDKALLRLSDLRKEISAKRVWTAPRSLVLLLGCSTGTSRVDTGISLAGSLLNLGAVGVLATECTVYTDLVARVARDLSVGLFAKKAIGEALREVVWQLARDGCPMGLVFTYVGPVEARLPS